MSVSCSRRVVSCRVERAAPAPAPPPSALLSLAHTSSAQTAHRHRRIIYPLPLTTCINTQTTNSIVAMESVNMCMQIQQTLSKWSEDESETLQAF